MRRAWWWLVIGVVVLVAALGAATEEGQAVVSKVLGDVVPARGRKGVFDQVADEVERQLGELAPQLTAGQARRAGEVLAAQAVHETGGGVTIAWRDGWNWGNVTAGSRALWPGPVVEGPDTEYDAAGNVKNIAQRFRKYASLSESVADFLTGVLNWQRERQSGARAALYSGDAAAYATALYSAGYYTAPVASYVAGTGAVLAALGTPPDQLT